jgi:isopentenyl-diphosphate delta-isomerase
VELMRRSDANHYADFWDWGIPTADALRAARPLCDAAGATLIASGGIATPRDVAIAIALGAHLGGAARPMLKTLREQGQQALEAMLLRWQHHLRCMMFLSGSGTIADLRNAEVKSEE